MDGSVGAIAVAERSGGLEAIDRIYERVGALGAAKITRSPAFSEKAGDLRSSSFYAHLI